MRSVRAAAFVSLTAALLVAAHAARGEPRFSSGPSRGEAERIARDWLETQGLDASEIAELELRRHRVSRSGVRHLHFQQRHAGLDVFGAGLAIAVDPAGRLVPAGDRLVRRARSAAATPRLAAAAVAARAAAAFGAVEAFDPRLPPKLVWLPTAGGELRLGWHLALRALDGRHVWSVVVDADDGALLFSNDWVARDAYRVFAPPLVNPDEGSRILAPGPAVLAASPQGWHDQNGLPGADTNETNGFAAVAQDDADADDAAGFRPNGGPSRTFDFALDTSRDPSTHLPASVAQLFYLVSWLHDVLWRYGFDAASGNFERVSPTTGDPVIADVQDGSDVDNARFLTPPDGFAPRMEMFLWNDARLVVSSPPAIAGVFGAGGARFGLMLTPGGLAGQVVAALDAADAAGPSTTDGCSAFFNAAQVAGRIALVDRGTCLFVEKLANAQAAGAIGVIVVNNLGTGLITMSGSDPALAIPSLFLSQFDGSLVRAQLAAGVSASLAGYTRDSALDVGIVIHEYAHGLTNRLTGGGVDCLSATQSRGMGEGWSDFFALALTQQLGDTRAVARGIGSYVVGQPPTGPGIRVYRYATSTAQNPRTFGHVALLLPTQVHAMGEVWAVALWDLWWSMVEPYGFDPALAAGEAGSDRVLQLVIDALSLQACNPTFLDARNALLAADVLPSGSRNRCRIWNAMAKRGMGVSAADGGSAASQAVTEAFDLPAECRLCGDVDDDEAFDLLDIARARRALAELDPRLVAPEKCNAVGPVALGDADGDGVLDDCTGADLVVLRQVLAGIVPAVPDACAPALGLFR